MSATSTPATQALYDYVRAHTAAEDPFLEQLKLAAGAAGLPAIWISHEQARLMHVVLRAAGAKRIVEVGTLAGYSAIVMARAAGAGAKVRTLELSPRHAAFAREWIARSDVADSIEVLEGDARVRLREVADESCDAMFIDADKQGYPEYLAQALRIVRPGGLVLVDNAFGFGQILDPSPTDADVPHVRAFNDLVTRTPELDAVIAPIGDGLWIGVVR